MRLTLYIAGFLLLANGLLWIAQGTGLFSYPSYSFMVDDMTWAWAGAAAALAGIALIVIARQRG